jgi:sugar phosphate isomerase/epimerase
MMNDPRRAPLDEARWAASHGFDFLDLTLEGPAATASQIDARALRAALRDGHLDVVGHTAWYLPFGSPVERVRRAAVEEVAATFPLFAELGARGVTVHVAPGISLFGHDHGARMNAASFAELAERGAPHGLRILVEHPPDPAVTVADLRTILAADRRLDFHLDVGHAHVHGDRLAELVQAFGERMAHVHVSDNRGSADDHMPLGAGKIQWGRVVRLLRQAGYDGTITLEVVAVERDYVMMSAEKMRRWWAAKGADD